MYAKKFFVGLLVVLIFNIAVVAQAEEVDPYFSWEIKNPDDYQKYNSLIKELFDNNKMDIRDEIYKRIALGRYLEAAIFCRTIEPYQKLVLGTDYFDEGLIELTAKLYLEAGELDKAERKINFLSDNARDNLTKIRALNLKSDLLNRRGNYAESLQAAITASKILKNTPDEKLNLITLSQAARALCGIGEIQKSVAIVNEINPTMQDLFGEDSVTTFSLISTTVELCRKTQKYDIGEDWLKFKLSWIPAQNLPVIAEAQSESANFYFETNDAAKGEEMLKQSLSSTDKCVNELNNVFATPKLYKEINRIAVKYLDENHPISLNSAFSLAYVKSNFGDIQQAIEVYEKNLPKFKKFFGEDNIDTLDMTELLSNNYLLLGRYDDAKKVAEERLNICKKHFGDHDRRTIDGTIDLADVHYRMGKYKTADELLADIQAQNVDLFEKSPTPDFVYESLFVKANGARLRDDIPKYSECLQNIYKLYEKDNPQHFSAFVIDENEFKLVLEAEKMLSITGIAHNNLDHATTLINFSSTIGMNYHPEVLKMTNDIAESYIKYGDLKGAERYNNQIRKLIRANIGENNFCEWMALNTLSKIRRAEYKFDEAFNLDNQALQIADNICGKKSLERFQSLDAIASDHAAKENFNEAIKIRERALVDYKKILEDTDAATIKMMTNLAENYVASGRYLDAIKLCDEALALQKFPIYTNNHINFYPCVTELIRIKAQAQKLSGDYANAYANYKNLIQAYEAIRATSNNMPAYLSKSENKSKWFAEVVPVYKVAASVAASDKIGDTEFAFFCTELCKGRNLIDHFDDILISKGYMLTLAEKQKLANKQKLLDSCRDISEYALATNDDELFLDTESIRTGAIIDIENFKGDLREKYSENIIPKDSQKQDDKNLNLYLLDQLDLNVWEQPNIWSWNAILKNFDVKKNQKAIPNGACLVEFMKVSDDSLVVTFLRNEGEVQAANISVDKRFFDDCRLYHKLNAKAKSEMSKNAAILNNQRQQLSVELSVKLMPTLEKFAGNANHWIISPDAELNLVPFETLLYHDKLLVESVDVSYVPSLAVMNLMKKREQKNSYLGRNKDLFAMGNAIYGNSSPTAPRGGNREFLWNDLPGTAQELNKISPLFERKTIFQREQATEKNLWENNTSGELSQYKYLLFAAHGIFDTENPENSAIVLSQKFNDETYDGYVTVGEWMGYDLRSNLVYLSACESGLGNYQAGEGIVGIPYALTVAGNKDTVMSLWKVDDEATAEFTSAVFEKLHRGQSEVSALNKTKREFLKHNNSLYKNPAVWAAFVLYGI